MIARRSMIAALAVTALVAGCSSDEGANTSTAADTPPPVTGVAGPQNSTSEAPVGAPPSTAAGTEPSDELPAQLLDAAGGSTDDARLLAYLYGSLQVASPQEKQWMNGARASESAMAACMGDQGFTYTPTARTVPPEVSMSREEFAATYGFGAAAPVLGTYPQTEDPNLAYSLTLSEAESLAYNTALRGCMESVPAENPDARFEADVGAAGARSVAAEQFRGVVLNDERVVDAVTIWSGCIADAGFTFDSPDAMRSSFYNRVGDLEESELGAFLDEEIMVATVNLGCEAPYLDTFRQVVVDRFDEYRALYQSALASGAAPAANG